MARPLTLRKPVALQSRMDIWCMFRARIVTLFSANSLKMMSPTAPLANKQLIWHLYSAQAYGIVCNLKQDVYQIF